MDSYTYRQLSVFDVEPFKQLLAVFGVTFGEEKLHRTYIPDDSHVRALLARPRLISIAVELGEEVVGGLVAYESEKVENKRGEIYIYDIGVREAHRQNGIASCLMEEMRAIARVRGARVIFAQVERGDKKSIKLYELFGKSEHPHHFDIDP